jgi:hypothetical protein
MLPDKLMEKRAEYSALKIPILSTENPLNLLEVGVRCSVSGGE